MKTVYSTLRRFHSLTIREYRYGSVRADFEMRIAGSIEAQDLIAKTERLGTEVTASLVLETKGIPPRPAAWELGPTTNDYFHILRRQHSGYSHGADLETAALLMVLAYTQMKHWAFFTGCLLILSDTVDVSVRQQNNRTTNVVVCVRRGHFLSLLCIIMQNCTAFTKEKL